MKHYRIVKTAELKGERWSEIKWNMRIHIEVYGLLMSELFKNILRMRQNQEQDSLFVPEASLSDFDAIVDTYLGPDVEELEEAFKD